mmetsp:Transcript_60938/g.170445  ORF Transcript_60938/g.170445 Transcript_60938/m.170445 type:complete len:200 (-) Transcript_60938:127-726(-)
MSLRCRNASTASRSSTAAGSRHAGRSTRSGKYSYDSGVSNHARYSSVASPSMTPKIGNPERSESKNVTLSTKKSWSDDSTRAMLRNLGMVTGSRKAPVVVMPKTHVSGSSFWMRVIVDSSQGSSSGRPKFFSKASFTAAHGNDGSETIVVCGPKHSRSLIGFVELNSPTRPGCHSSVVSRCQTSSPSANSGADSSSALS